MKKLAVMIVTLISFLSFSSFSFAQGVMTNTEINNSKKKDDSKRVGKTRKPQGSKSKKDTHLDKKTGQPHHKRVKHVPVAPTKTEDQTQQKTNP